MKIKSILITVIVAALVGGAAFLGGMKYQASKTPAFVRQFGNGNTNAIRNGQARNATFRPLIGDITASDDKSITVKMADGSSKIVILSDSTTISKTSDGNRSDLTDGKRVGVFGIDNADGSVTAQNIQLNPNIREGGR
jgi:hypothetical protein